MFQFVRKNQLYENSNYKIRRIKADLAKETNLQSSEINLVYKNLILEDYQRITHYKIWDVIWFGTLAEYNEEFGDHIVIELKSNCNPDAMTVTEKILIKKNESISQIRSLLVHMYDWIEKVKFSNIKMKQLLDDETIENCGLIENPTIIIGSPMLVVTKGSDLISEEQKNVTNQDSEKMFTTVMRVNPYEISPLMELLRKLTNHNPEKGSLLSRILSFIKLPSHQQFFKEEFIVLISEWVKYFDKIESGEISDVEMNSIFRQDFSENIDNCLLNIELNTTNDHLLAMNKMLKVTEKIFAKYFPKILKRLFQKNLNAVKPIMEAFLVNKPLDDYDRKVVNLRLVNSINFYFEKFLSEGSALEKNEIYLQMLDLSVDILPIICDMNSIINEYWQSTCYNKRETFRKFFVNPNLDKDNPIQIMSATELTVKDARKILSDKYVANDLLLIQREVEHFYNDEEKLPSGETISSVTLSRPDNLKKVKSLGQGGFGSVYLYKDELTGQETVLKKLKIPFKKKLEDTTEIIREIIAFSRLGPHKRIIQYFEYYVKNRSFYIEMEYMKGGSLKSYLDKTGPLNENDVRHFSLQILEGLKYLHSRTIFHRDIKAENVLLDENKNAKLTDFGLAKCFYGSMEDYQTGYRQSQGGTERWMAPEISVTGIFGAPADIWSFGATLIEMVTAKPPYSDLPASVAQSKISNSGRIDFKLPESVNLQIFIDSCLKIVPAERLTVDQLLCSKFLNE